MRLPPPFGTFGCALVLGVWASGCFVEMGPIPADSSGGGTAGNGGTGQGATTDVGGGGSGGITNTAGSGGSGAVGGTGGNGGTGGVMAVCGNGEKEAGEDCDDGNDINTDACVEGCKNAVCGDNFVQMNIEECDDGNNSDSDACVLGCKHATCGDMVVQTEVEECDDGNDIDTDGCVQGCQMAECGDTFVQAGVEECDDGNGSNTDGCVQGCKAAKCGDTFVQAGVEQCEDGNAVGGDGCFNCQNDCGCAGCTAGTPCTGCGLGGPVSGAVTYKNTTTNHCYVAMPTNLNWNAARGQCQGWGGDLAALSTTAELNDVLKPEIETVILSSLSDRGWTGGNNIANMATYVWSNGEAWNYTPGSAPWQSGEPGGGTNCVVLGPSGGNWTLRGNSCSEVRPYICER